MKNYSYTVPFILAAWLMASCQKDELPVPAHDPGNVITATVDMDPTYKWQIYFDLETNTVVGQNLKSAWDLGFETSTDGFHVVTNTSKAMYARNTMNTDFAAVTDTLGFVPNRKWDQPSGNMDSTAIGDWRGTSHVYVIDRGYNELGTHQGFRKIQFQSVDATSYTVRFAALNGSGEVTLTIPKNDAYNFTFLSLTGSGSILTIEPPKANWDLCFTQYLHTFHEPSYMPYLVTGCVQNRYNTPAVSDDNIAFANINYSQAQTYVLSPAVNTIGYGWKTFSGTIYTVNPNISYIIRDAGGLYYKLHFIDFYNDMGTKGHPKWEYQQL